MTYELIEAAVRRANPVPEPSRLPNTAAAPPRIFQEGTHVELLEQQPSLDEARHQATDRRTPRWRLVVAAAAAVVVAFLVGLVVAGREPQPTAPADSVAPRETVETVPAAEPTLLTPEMEFGPIPPGEYRIDSDGDPVTTLSATLTAGGSRWFSLEAGVGRDTPDTSEGYSFSLLVAEVDRVNTAGCATQGFVGDGEGDARQWADLESGARPSRIPLGDRDPGLRG